MTAITWRHQKQFEGSPTDFQPLISDLYAPINLSAAPLPSGEMNRNVTLNTKYTLQERIHVPSTNMTFCNTRYFCGSRALHEKPKNVPVLLLLLREKKRAVVRDERELLCHPVTLSRTRNNNRHKKKQKNKKTNTRRDGRKRGQKIERSFIQN